MSNYVFSHIKSYLKSQSFLVNDSWLKDCIEYYCSTHPQANEDSIITFVKEQFLLSDLREINNVSGSLPSNLSQQTKTILSGKYTLQLIKLYDISVPKFKQLEKIRNISNANVEATNENSQSWEPTGKRILQLFLTDGIQEILAIEYKPIRILNDSLYPGLKITLIGPVTCRRGVLLLEETNISIRGGEVEDLLIVNALENVLANALKLPTNEDPYNDASKSRKPAVQNDFEDDCDIDLAEIEQIERAAETPERRENSTRNAEPINNQNSAPKSNNPVLPNINEFPEDDDIFFEDLEIEEGFLCNVEKKSVDEVSKMQNETPKASSSSALQFPNDDFDLNDVDFDSDLTWTAQVNNKSVISKTSKETVAGHKRSSAQLSPLQPQAKIPCQSSSNKKITDFLGAQASNEKPVQRVCDFICEILKKTLTDSPILKTVYGKISAIGKLEMKHELWILNGTIKDESGKVDIDFSSQFMEKLLDLTPHEFLKLKRMCKTDQDMTKQLKEKLMDGQNTLQKMECLIELELKKDTKPLATSFRELSQSEKEAHMKSFWMLKSKNQI